MFKLLISILFISEHQIMDSKKTKRNTKNVRFDDDSQSLSTEGNLYFIYICYNDVNNLSNQFVLIFLKTIYLLISVNRKKGNQKKKKLLIALLRSHSKNVMKDAKLKKKLSIFLLEMMIQLLKNHLISNAKKIRKNVMQNQNFPQYSSIIITMIHQKIVITLRRM